MSVQTMMVGDLALSHSEVSGQELHLGLKNIGSRAGGRIRTYVTGVATRHLATRTRPQIVRRQSVVVCPILRIW